MILILLVLSTSEGRPTQYDRSGCSTSRPGALGRPDADIQCRCTALLALDTDDLRSPDDENTRAVLQRAFDQDRLPFESRLETAVTVEFEA
jgi:hypothetical protein